MNQINRDDIEDTSELLNDLYEWVIEHSEKVDPGKMGITFIAMGTEIIERHAINKNDVDELIVYAVGIGKDWAKDES